LLLPDYFSLCCQQLAMRGFCIRVCRPSDRPCVVRLLTPIPCDAIFSSVSSLGDTLQGGDTRRKKLCANLQRIVKKRGRIGKKGVGWHPGVGDTRVKVIKSDSDSDSDEQKKVARFEKKREEEPGMTRQNWRLKKVARFFRKKNRGVTPSVAAPRVTHPSDATDLHVGFQWNLAQVIIVWRAGTIAEKVFKVKGQRSRSLVIARPNAVLRRMLIFRRCDVNAFLYFFPVKNGYDENDDDDDENFIKQMRSVTYV